MKNKMKFSPIFFLVFISFTAAEVQNHKSSRNNYRAKLKVQKSKSDLNPPLFSENRNISLEYSSPSFSYPDNFEHFDQHLDEDVGFGTWVNNRGHKNNFAPQSNVNIEPDSKYGKTLMFPTFDEYQINPNYLMGLHSQKQQFRDKERTAKVLLNSGSNKKLSPPTLPPSYSWIDVASSLLAPAPNLKSVDVYRDVMAAASGHGKGHGWGWGWGWGWDMKHNHKHGEYNNALALLGLLGLLSLLSSVLLLLTTTTTTTTPTTTTAAMLRIRIRRSQSLAHEDVALIEAVESDADRFNRLFDAILPFLIPVAVAINGKVSSECTFQGVCLTNRLLVKEFGMAGRPKGKEIAMAVSNLLKQFVVNGKVKGFEKKVAAAGLEGRNQKDCEKIYPTCEELKNGTEFLPFLIQMNEVPLLLQRLETMKNKGLRFNFNL